MNRFNLDTHPKIKIGFTTPPDYFEELPQQILRKIATPNKETKLFTLNRIIYAAAAILVLALSIPFFIQNSGNSFEQIEMDFLENYLSYQSNVSQYELISLMDTNELESIQVDFSLDNTEVEELLLTNPNFENYIIE